MTPYARIVSLLTRRSARPAAALLLALAVGIGAAACKTFNTYSADSRPVSRPITVDGKTDDWQGDLYVVPNERLSIGFLNDQEYLYVCLLSSDATIRSQIMVQGFTLWFDPKGGKEKAFGIRYPLGSPSAQPPRAGEIKEPPPADPSTLDQFDVVKSEKEPAQRMDFSQAKSLELKVASSTGLIVYEMKIPLAAGANNPVAVGAAPGKTIGIGFETGKVDISKMPRGERGGTPGGGEGTGRPPMGGAGGGQTGEGGRGGVDMRGGLAESLRVWAFVQLSMSSDKRAPEAVSFVKNPD